MSIYKKKGCETKDFVLQRQKEKDVLKTSFLFINPSYALTNVTVP